LGSRTFRKWVNCSVVSARSSRTAFLLSVFLGGFAVDRFYLGDVGWAMFKLLSFGGLGVWSVVDALLLAIGYLTPSDGSLFAPMNESSIIT
jgi:TM2 domain-containing membrane protein YozV